MIKPVSPRIKYLAATFAALAASLPGLAIAQGVERSVSGRHDWAGLVFLPVLGVFLVIFLLLKFFVIRLKTKALTAFIERFPSTLSIRIINPEEDYKNIDFSAIHATENDLLACGFQKKFSYTVDWPQGSINAKGFGIVYFHPVHKCFAEVTQAIRPDGKLVPFRYTMMSYMTDNWSLATLSKEAMPESFSFRQDRALWTSHPGASPAELLQHHIDMRGKMIDNLYLNLLDDSSFESFCERQKRQNADRKKVLESRGGYRMVRDIENFKKYPKTEWLGDYPKEAKRLKNA